MRKVKEGQVLSPLSTLLPIPTPLHKLQQFWCHCYVGSREKTIKCCNLHQRSNLGFLRDTH